MKKERMRIDIFLSVFILFCTIAGYVSPSYADIIPASRRILWSPGIPGGIPQRTTVYTTINSAAYGNGSTDATSAIQTAISNCPVGQVVALSAGVFKVAGTVSVNKGVVLRGNGMGSTIINLGGTGKFTMSGSSGTSFNQTISSGYTKGSTSLTLASTSGLSVGDYVAVTESADPTGALQGWPVDPKGCTWCGNNNGNYLMTQIVKVTGISSNTITIEKPLYVSYASGLSPRVMNAIGHASTLVNAGFEDFTVNADGTSWVFTFQRALYSWVKNVEINQFAQYGIIFKYSYGCVVEGNKIHHGASETASSYGSGRAYGVQFMMWNSDHLVENNVLYHLRHMLSFEGGGSGCVFAYNYMYESLQDSGFPNIDWLMGQIQTHGSHPYMNLYEGNQFDHAMEDYTWGSASFNTYFRNNIRALGQPTVRLNHVALEFQKNNQYMNVVGNVLGWSGMSGTYEVSGSATGIYLFGDTSDGGTAGADPGVKASVYRHGNFDYVNNTTLWDAGNSDHAIPVSLYRASTKPEWWCSETPWPAIGPDVSPLVSDIPAHRAYSGETCNSVGPVETPKLPGIPSIININ